ncbi:cytochrome c553 [Furfurilactobacillus curtus]|uniref:Cytochrome c553 n=2 Tax=Furfurilactobacillus curtus TaxID=1746200 RepID=A0ABQ5JSZ0_9LACO
MTLLLGGQTGRAAVMDPTINSRAAIVIDEQTGQILAAKDRNERLPIASISKLLVVYLVEQKIANKTLSLQEKVPIDPKVAQLSTSPELTNVPLSAGRQYTIAELLADALLPSGNAAAVALGEAVTGSVPATNSAMTRLLRRWGIHSPRLVSPAGLRNGDMGELRDPKQPDTAENKLSVTELAVVSRHLLEDYPAVRDITRRAQLTTTGVNGEPYSIVNTNLLTKHRSGKYTFTGVKTGSSPSIGGNFVGETRLAGRRVITVVLGSGGYRDQHTRFDETIHMLDQVAAKLRPVRSGKRGPVVYLQQANTSLGQVRTQYRHQPTFFVARRHPQPVVTGKLHVKSSRLLPLRADQTIGWTTLTTASAQFVDGHPQVEVVSEQKVGQASWVTQMWRKLFGNH